MELSGWRMLDSFINKMLEKEWLRRSELPENPDLQTYDIALSGLSLCGHAVRFIRPDLLDEQLCLVAVRNNGTALEHVPDGLRSDYVIDTAIEHGCSLNDLPSRLVTPYRQLAAVKANPSQMELIPHSEQTPAMVDVLLFDYESTYELRWVNPSLITQETAERAVSLAGNALRYVPDDYRTYELCLSAVADLTEAIAFVPDHFRDTQMCRTAFDQDDGISFPNEVLQAIPKAEMTPFIAWSILMRLRNPGKHFKSISTTDIDALNEPNLIADYLAILKRPEAPLLRECQVTRLKATISATIRTLPLAQRHLDEWLLPTSDGSRTRFDELLELVDRLKVLFPGNTQVHTLDGRVRKLEELTLRKRQSAIIDKNQPQTASVPLYTNDII